MKILQEFKTFAMRGNVIDLAIGIVIGASFTSITNSLVNDIINPIIGIITGRVDLAEKAWVLRPASGDLAAVTLNYGNFIAAILNFLIIAFVIFLVIRQVNKLTGKEMGVKK